MFALARTAIVAQDPGTYNPAFEFLMRATRLYESGVLQTEVQVNFARCTSGIFYNLAGTLYQESKWGPAVRFLKEACAHGSRALAVYRTAIPTKNVDENWTTLEHQLYRRWELLAVCYLKIGDRQVSLSSHSLSYPSHSWTKL
jgi:separase